MKVLIVGAGAVGQVYGYHLLQGGADVTFLVKEKYVETLRDFPLVVCRLHVLRMWNRNTPFTGYHVLGKISQITPNAFDYVILTVPSDALRSGTWLKDLLQAVGDSPTLVNLTVSPLDQQLIVNQLMLPEDRFVAGAITFSAYQAPIRQERIHPVPHSSSPNKVIAYTPAVLTFYGKNKSRSAGIAKALTKGGMRSVSGIDTTYLVAPLTAFFNCFLVGLEAEQWDMKRLATSSTLRLTCQASGECLEYAATSQNRTFAKYLKYLIIPFFFRLLLLFIHFFYFLLPMDLERFLEYHFIKVGNQTKFIVQSYVTEAQKKGIPMNYTTRLCKKNQRFNTAPTTGSSPTIN